MANLDKLTVLELENNELNTGILSNGKNIDKQFSLSEETVNFHLNENTGIGPRYGMQPVPYHSSTDFDPTSATPSSVLRTQFGQPFRFSQYKSNFNNNVGLNYNLAQAVGCNKIFAIYPVPVLTESSGFAKSEICYFFVSNSQYINETPASGPTLVHDKTIHVGFLGKNASNSLATIKYAYPEKGFDNPFYIDCYRTKVYINPILNFPVDKNDEYKKDEGRYFYSSSFFFVNGKEYEFGNILGYFDEANAGASVPGLMSVENHSKEIISGNFSSDFIDFSVSQFGSLNYGVWGSYALIKKYVYSKKKLGNKITDFNYMLTARQFKDTDRNCAITTAPTSTITGTYLGPGFYTYAIFKNKKFKINSSYACFAIAKSSPILCIYKENSVNQRPNTTLKELEQTGVLSFSPTELYTQPISEVQNNFSVPYDATKGVQPSPIPKDAATARNGTNRVCSGGVNTGLLRKSSNYEIGYSVLDKSTGVESNVKSFFFFGTNDDDFSSVSIYRKPTASPLVCPIAYLADFRPFFENNKISFVFEPSTNSTLSNDISHFRYNFFYRQVGEFEWLPTTQIDVLAFYYDSDVDTIWLCQAPIASVPGGQPGGFVDNSPLPKDNWLDVKTFQNYMFWCSSKSVQWSNKNNPFTYPVLNSVNIPSGYAKGIIEHAYPGQAVQDSRLLVFTSEAIYAGRFTGQFDQMQVRVSPTESGTFDRPGSDFALRYWTSHTAFSSRAAVIAQGVLYFWGPTGLWRDVGNETPDKRFSYVVEPLIHKLYDPKMTDNIHGVYNDKTKEVIFFFPPRKTVATGVPQSYQKALVYNIQNDAFHIFDFQNTIVDAAQIVNIQMSNSINTDIQGDRITLYIHDALFPNEPMQPVFFDEKCNTGDVRVTNISMVKEVQANGINRRLIVNHLQSYGLPSFGDTLTISNHGGYTNKPAETTADGIYAVVGSAIIDAYNASIDIAPIDGAWSLDLPIEVLPVARYFPVAWNAEHGFPANLRSDYWAPGGLSTFFRWNYCHTLFMVDGLLLRGSGNQIRMKFYSILGSGSSDRTLTLTNNCRGNFQAHSQIVQNQQNSESQGIAFEITTLTGRFCGSRYTLQYLAYHGQSMGNGLLRTWEN